MQRVRGRVRVLAADRFSRLLEESQALLGVRREARIERELARAVVAQRGRARFVDLQALVESVQLEARGLEGRRLVEPRADLLELRLELVQRRLLRRAEERDERERDQRSAHAT